MTGGPFTDLFDFCRRIDKRVVNRRVIEALIRAGAFDAIDDHRAKLLASAGVALEAAEQAERNAMQGGLFDMGGGAQEDTAHYVEVPRWSERERLMNEKPALGFFFSGHPYHAYARELASFVKRRLGQLEAQREPVLLAGVVMSTRTQMTRRGKMAVVQLDDGTTQLEITVFNELWEAERAKIKEDELLLVEGKVQRDDFSGGLRVSADKLLHPGRGARPLCARPAPDHERRLRRQAPAGPAGAFPQRALPGAPVLPQRRRDGRTAAAGKLARAARRCPACGAQPTG
jgi:DNA polymerase-3 subunit alpha